MVYHTQSRLKKVKGDKQPQEIPMEQVEDISLPVYNTERKFDGHTEDEQNYSYKNILESDEKKMQQEKSPNFLDCIGILHQNHTDRLYQGKLYHQTESGTLKYKFSLKSYRRLGRACFRGKWA